MHAVFAASPSVARPGFFESAIGRAVGAVGAAVGCDAGEITGISLILILRLIDAGPHVDLSGTRLDFDLVELEVAGPGDPT